MDISSERTAGLLVQQRDLHLDVIRAWTMTIEPMLFRRTKGLIERSDPETFNVCLLLDGAMARSWGTGEAVYNPGDLHISDSSQPFELRAQSANELISCVGVEIPKRLLSPRPDRLVGQALSGREGLGALLAQFMTRLTEDTGSFRSTDGPRLSLVAADLTSALIAHHLGDSHGQPLDAHRRTLILRIRAFIQHRLADPELTPGAIAAAHHISVRYLHHLFHKDGQSVGQFIRRQRLERCHADLADPRLINRTVADVGARWGFQDAAVFNRAFKAAYGITPGEHRRRQSSVKG